METGLHIPSRGVANEANGMTKKKKKLTQPSLSAAGAGWASGRASELASQPASVRLKLGGLLPFQENGMHGWLDGGTDNGGCLLTHLNLGSGLGPRGSSGRGVLGRSLHHLEMVGGGWAPGALVLGALVLGVFTLAWGSGSRVFTSYNGRDQYPPGGWRDGWMDGCIWDIQ
ncbi:uncharacterized protein B0H64DRAFT_34890 [Chaetomium fimeti]|uniref:Uncharacterized protein n=1 Tax=Chaetomium fimeti TaxID=1854472 RepID=A0AAE0LYF8_9PEZI|nr:hypothetical protein B0H64DRAFT_34890 [Chaetomium fimeti]